MVKREVLGSSVVEVEVMVALLVGVCKMCGCIEDWVNWRVVGLFVC